MGAMGSGTGVKLLPKAVHVNWVPERCHKALLAFLKNAIILLVGNERRGDSLTRACMSWRERELSILQTKEISEVGHGQ